MSFDPSYQESSLTREEVDALPGPVAIEFGSSDCSICAGFTPLAAEALDRFGKVRHIRVQDGRGKPLGRSFRVKLWPTFVLLRDGQVVQQLARPSQDELIGGLEAITSGA